MTCIVGVVEGDTVWMGGDSAGTNSWLDQCIYDEPKVFRNDGMLIGSCGSHRQAQLLRYVLKPPDHDPRSSIEKYMVKDFINAVRECFTAGGVCEKRDNVEGHLGAFIVGYRGRLFVIHSDYQVRMPKKPYAAVGCADQIAHGALFASEHMTNTKDRVELALHAAEQFSAGVRGPFVVESLGPA